MYTGAKIIRDGLVLQFDPANIKCFRGNTNLINESKTIDIGGTGADFPTYTTHTSSIINGFLESTTTVIIADSWRCYRYKWLQTYFSEFPLSDTNYIYSFDYKSNNSSGGVWFDVRGSFGTLEANVYLPNTNNIWKREYLIFNKSFTNATNCLTGVRGGSQIGDYVSIRKIKLERGLVMTEWRPSKSDIDYTADILDLSGHNNHGEIVNNILYDSNNCGSLKFDATNAYINVNNLSSITNGTISFWSKMDDTSNWLFMTGQTTSYFILATSGLGDFYHWNIGNNTLINYVDGLVNNTPPSDLGWHYITLTGVNLSSWTIFNIGIYSGTDFKYNGKMSNIMFYNRALSQSEIQQNYNATKGRFGI